MVRVTSADIPEEEQDLLDFLSEDSDGDDEVKIKKKHASLEPLVWLDETFPNTLVVIGVPRVGAEKYDKLVLVLQKKISEELQKKGAEVSGESFTTELPMRDNMTQGICFLNFSSGFDAEHACKHLNGFSLDAKHKFKACLIDQFDEIVKRDENYRPPIRLLGFTREGFRYWLNDPRCREQFVIRYSDETEIFCHDPVKNEPFLVYNGHRERSEGKRIWTDFRVQWSPQGSYLTTFHRPGVVLWAGEQFAKKARFEHKDVKQIDYSHSEKYIVTWDGSPASMRNEKALRVWRIMSGELLRTFCTPEKTPRGNDFPYLLWSCDDEFVARLGDKELFVYKLPEMTLVEDVEGKKSSLKFALEKIDWSPSENILSIWIPGSDDTPGRLLLLEIPSRKELASKNVYNVRDASMHWQSKGDFLCLRTVVYKKTGKKGRKEFTQLEIFRMREKNIPIDNIQIEDLPVKQLHWEKGYSKRFALIVQDENSQYQAVRFYRVSDTDARRDTFLVTTLEISRSMNCIEWSPWGSNFLLASLGTEGTLMFCTLNDQDKVEVLHKDEHFMVNDIKWSPCGRYVATSVTIPIIASASISAYRVLKEAGYRIWSFQGKSQYTCSKERFYQFLWRPHPPPLLGRQKIKEIKGNLKDYSRKYDIEDEKLRSAQRNAYSLQLNSEMDEFQKILDELELWKIEQPEYDEWALGYQILEDQFEWEDREEVIEEEIETREEIIG